MKKLKIILVFILAVSLVLFVACDSKVDECHHAYGDWITTVPATCEEAGSRTRVCANDASHKETQAINPVGHAYGDWIITVPATSEATGFRSKTCSKCQTTVNNDIPALNGLAWQQDKYRNLNTADTLRVKNALYDYIFEFYKNEIVLNENCFLAKTIPIGEYGTPSEFLVRDEYGREYNAWLSLREEELELSNKFFLEIGRAHV